ncbi:energy transducer TonB [Sphingomonas oryzagri]
MGFSVVGVEPRGNSDDWIEKDDNPGSIHGEVIARFHIDAAGKITDCAVIRSSGDIGLDNLTCRLLSKRGRFRPSSGTPLTGAYRHIW